MKDTNNVYAINVLSRALGFCVSFYKKESIVPALDIMEYICTVILKGDDYEVSDFKSRIKETVESSGVEDIKPLLTTLEVYDEHMKKGKVFSLQEANFYFNIIRELLPEMRILYKEKKFEQLYDLVDAIHCLPDALINPLWDSNSYWKTYIYPYRKKWDLEFLIAKEKELRKNSTSSKLR